jgi:signal transduction histidine kinase
VAESLLNFLVAILEAGLALIVLRHLARFGRAFPWLAALMAFFFLRAADRLYVALAGEEPLAFSVLVDGLAVVILVLLLVGMRRMVHGLQAVADAAALREEEYQRALVDYRRLMRHRIANPLAAVRGGIQVLKDLPNLPRDEQSRLLDGVYAAVLRLENVALNPRPLSKEEAALEGRPGIEGRRGPGRLTRPYVSTKP